MAKKKYDGDNRRKSEWWKLLFVVGGFSVASAATGWAAHPNAPEPVEPDPIVFPTYAGNFDGLQAQNAGLAEQNAALLARSLGVRIVYRDTGRTLPPIIDSIPYPVPGPIQIDSFPYPVPGPVSIVQMPAVQQRSRWPTNAAIALGGTLLGIAVRSVFDGETQCTFVVEDDDDDHDDDYGRE